MDAYIVHTSRTAIGKSHPEKGLFRHIRADEMIAELLKSAVEHLSQFEVNAKEIDDIYLGCVGQHLEQGKNIARLASLLAGIPDSVPGATFNRLCASSLQAFNSAALTLHAKKAQIIFAGGVEHMDHVPMQAAIDYHSGLMKHYEFPFNNMGLTAEKVAEAYKISREEQDQFALLSHKKAIDAQNKGVFKKEIYPIVSNDLLIDKDQSPREDTTLEQLSQLKTIFKENGSVTAGNSSPINDGASLTVLTSKDFANKYSLATKAQVIDFTVVGLDPCMMGLGPIPAVTQLLRNNQLTIKDIDLFEINEAFASQAIACIRDLHIPQEKVNPFGGAIALGHPLGSTGTRLITTLLNGLETIDGEYGIATLCIGHGQGMATLIKRI